MSVVTEAVVTEAGLTDPLAGLSAAADALCATAVASLAHRDTVEALHRQLERLNAAVTRVDATFASGGDFDIDGARSGASWVATRRRLPFASTRRRFCLGRDVAQMAATEAAWLAGDISEAHVGLLAGARRQAGAELFGAAEEMLVGFAKKLSYREFSQALAYWCQAADPDGTEDKAAAHYRNRRLHLSEGYDGVGYLDAVFDPIGRAIFAKSLKAIEDELFAEDWAEAKSRVGDGVSVADLCRTPAQRRADAAVEMAKRAHAMPAGSRLPEPLFSVLVGYETFAGRICQLADGTVIAPGSLVRWLDQAWIERIVFDAPDRVTNVGVRRRIFVGGTRRAIEIRDRECFSEFCDVPAEDCQADHVQPWAAEGPTTVENGRLACGWHNRRRNRRT